MLESDFRDFAQVFFDLQNVMEEAGVRVDIEEIMDMPASKLIVLLKNNQISIDFKHAVREVSPISEGSSLSMDSLQYEEDDLNTPGDG